MVDMKDKATDILENYSNSYSQVDLETLTKFLGQIKSEAYREFAERLKNQTAYYWLDEINICDIDNVLKELTEKNDFKE